MSPFLYKDMTDDLALKIVAPVLTCREFFELSVYLYGYYDESHVGIRLKDESLNDDWDASMPDISASAVEFSREKWFPLFLCTSKLYKQRVSFENEDYMVSFSHKPTRVNFWHFQLWTKDSSGVCISKKDKGKTRLAKHIFERFIAKAIVFNKSAKKRFRCGDFDKAINPTLPRGAE